MYIQEDPFVIPPQMSAADSRIYWDILTYFDTYLYKKNVTVYCGPSGNKSIYLIKTQQYYNVCG